MKEKTPWATLAAIAANLAVAFGVYFNQGISEPLAFDPLMPKFWQGFACLFAHDNLWHLLGNLVFLAAVGPVVEFAGGGWRLMAVYLVSGAAGAASHYAVALTGAQVHPLLGASGAVAGCVGYASVRYLRTRVPVLPKVGVSVSFIALAWLAVQLVGSLLRVTSSQGSGAYWTHVAGFVAGLFMAFVLGGAKQARIEFGHEVLDKMNLRGPAAALAAAEEHIRRHPEDAKAWQHKAEALEDLGETDKASEAYIRLLKMQDGAERGETVERLRQIGGLAKISASERMKLADAMRLDDLDGASTLLESVASSTDVRQPDAYLALAELWKGTDNARSAEFGRLLAEEYPVHPATEIASRKGLLP